MSRSRRPIAADRTLDAASLLITTQLLMAGAFLFTFVVGAVIYALWGWAGTAIASTLVVIGTMFRIQAVSLRAGREAERAGRRSTPAAVRGGRRG